MKIYKSDNRLYVGTCTSDQSILNFHNRHINTDWFKAIVDARKFPLDTYKVSVD